MLAGLLFPPIVAAQYRLAPRSFGPAPAKPTRHFVPQLPAPPGPDTTGGNFSIVPPFPTSTSSLWSRPSPYKGLGRAFNNQDYRHHPHRQGGYYISPLPLVYGYSYLNSSDALAFYPSLWPPIDQAYVQSWRIAHEDLGSEATQQQNQQLTSQIQVLSRQIQSLEQDRQAAAQAASSQQPATPAKLLPVEFVYRDGRVIKATDYAIFGNTLWVFGAETTRKIPLASLDLSATRKLNDQRGVDVVLPASD